MKEIEKDTKTENMLLWIVKLYYCLNVHTVICYLQIKCNFHRNSNDFLYRKESNLEIHKETAKH